MKKSGTIHLVLKHKWYDMIESGEKPEEYRENTPYWRTRLLGSPFSIFYVHPSRRPVRLPMEEGKTVTFHRGYTNTTMTFDIEFLAFGKGVRKWGAPKGRCFIIRLGKRLDNGEIH